MKIIFIIGGARSGKSAFALKEASMIEGGKAFIATAEALDEEMKERIRKHRRERGAEWDTFEVPVSIAPILREADNKYGVIILDCLTLWLSNLVCHNLDVQKEIEDLLDALRKERAYHDTPLQFFVVSNEVGMGIVPENELARRFRDMTGVLNRRVAEIADEVYLVTAGIPLKIKNQK